MTDICSQSSANINQKQSINRKWLAFLQKLRENPEMFNQSILKQEF